MESEDVKKMRFLHHEHQKALKYLKEQCKLPQYHRHRHQEDRADKLSHLQRIKVSIAIIIANPFNSLG
ncbi:hypothetical protein [Yeosuana sp. AK3]